MGCCGSTQAANPGRSAPPTRATNVRTASVVKAPELPAVTFAAAAEKPEPPGMFRNLHDMVMRELVPSGPQNALGAVLIADAKSIHLLETVATINDLTKAGLPLVESLANAGRQPLPSMPAVYLVHPTAENAKLIARDWDMNPEMYGSAYIYLADEITPAFRSTLDESSSTRSVLKAIKQLRLDFICSSQFSYSLTRSPCDLDGPQLDSLQLFFGRSTTSLEVARAARRVGEGIVAALSCMGDRPRVRYQAASHCSELVAGEVHRGITRQLGSSAVPAEENGVLLIVDRTVDVVTTMLHQFTYEAMVFNILSDSRRVKEDHGQLTVSESNSDRASTLTPDDDYWNNIRYEHYDVLRSSISSELKAAINKSKAARLHPEMRDGDFTLGELSEGVRDMPHFQKRMRELNLHMELLILLREEMQQQRLDDFALAEQNFTVNETEGRDGPKKMNRKVGFQQLLDILSIPKAAKNAFRNKVQATLVFAITQRGLSPSEKTAIRDTLQKVHPEEPPIDQWLNGLETLHNIEKPESKWWKPEKKPKVTLDKAGAGEEVYLLSRAVPGLKGVMTSLLEGTVSEEAFPSMDGAGAPAIVGKSKRDRGNSLTFLQNTGAPLNSTLAAVKGPRIHVFIIGGVTQAELQVAASLRAATKRDIILAGTELISPATMHRVLPTLALRS